MYVNEKHLCIDKYIYIYTYIVTPAPIGRNPTYAFDIDHHQSSSNQTNLKTLAGFLQAFHNTHSQHTPRRVEGLIGWLLTEETNPTKPLFFALPRN